MLGVHRPCYGEYHCGDCNRRWDSCLAWRDSGQECKSCSKSLRASKLEQLFPYCCTNPLCGKQWKNRRVERSQCYECRSPGKMFLVKTDRRKYVQAMHLKVDGPSRVNHEEDLCERCKTRGDCGGSSKGRIHHSTKMERDLAEMRLKDVPERIKHPQRIVKIQELPDTTMKLAVGQFSANPIVGSGKIRPNWSYASALRTRSFNSEDSTQDNKPTTTISAAASSSRLKSKDSVVENWEEEKSVSLLWEERSTDMCHSRTCEDKTHESITANKRDTSDSSRGRVGSDTSGYHQQSQVPTQRSHYSRTEYHRPESHVNRAQYGQGDQEAQKQFALLLLMLVLLLAGVFGFIKKQYEEQLKTQG